MSLGQRMPSASLARNSSRRPIDTRLSRTFEVRSPLRPIVLSMSGRIDARRPLAVRLEDSCDTWSTSTPMRSRMIGGAVDHGIEQIHQHGFAGDCGRAASRELVVDHRERARLVVAHGDQPVAGENEGDRRGLRRRRVGLAHQRRGHVARAILDVEPAGDLDLLHFLARRHGDAEPALDQLVFAGRRVDEIEPDRVLRHLAVRRRPVCRSSDASRSGRRRSACERPLTGRSLGPIRGDPAEAFCLQDEDGRARTRPPKLSLEYRLRSRRLRSDGLSGRRLDQSVIGERHDRRVGRVLAVVAVAQRRGDRRNPDLAVAAVEVASSCLTAPFGSRSGALLGWACAAVLGMCSSTGSLVLAPRMC